MQISGKLLALLMVVGTADGLADRGPRGRIEGTISITRDGRRIASRVRSLVYLEGATPQAPGQAPVLRQKNLRFDRRVLVIEKGTTVEFVNDDKVFHNVFSVSAATKFDLGLYKSGVSKSVTFKRAGEVDVYCNIHPDMVATIEVVDSGYFATTSEDGAFRIEGVPAGTYAVVARQVHGPDARGRVKLDAGGVVRIELEVAEGKNDRHHLRKDGVPYGRYR